MAADASPVSDRAARLDSLRRVIDALMFEIVALATRTDTLGIGEVRVTGGSKWTVAGEELAGWSCMSVRLRGYECSYGHAIAGG
jgi:hypothetical protein